MRNSDSKPQPFNNKNQPPHYSTHPSHHFNQPQHPYHPHEHLFSHHNPFPYGYHLPHSSYFDHMQHFYPPLPYYPYPVPPITDKKPQKKPTREVINLESPPQVKVQQAAEIIVEKKAEDSATQIKKTKGGKLLGGTVKEKDYGYPQIGSLQSIFKEIVSMLVADRNNYAHNKELLSMMLKQGSHFTSDHQVFFREFYDALWKKFEKFKKTKQEIIKYIIRRTYHNAKIRKTTISKGDFDKLQQFHQKNIALHKSMNSQFLKKEFANKLFVTIYNEFLHQMDEQFDEENTERINRFSSTLSSAWIEHSVTIIQYESKLPWIELYKSKIRNIALDLKHQYDSRVQKRLQL